MSDNELLQQVALDVATVKQAIMGNGVKGLNERVGDIETWRETHPRICPLDAPPNPRKVNGWNIFFGSVAVISGIGALVIGAIK